MQLNTEFIDDVLLYHINVKRATHELADKMKKHIAENIEQGHNKIVIDLSAIEFVDSSFLGVLLFALKKVINIGGEVKLGCLQNNVESIFEMTRLNRIFNIYPDIPAAMKAFKSGNQ